MFRIVLLFIFSFITCRSRILLCVEFKNFCSFAVCSVLLFFHNLCPDYSWIPFELRLLGLFSVVCLRLFIPTEKWAYLKNERVFLYSKTDRLVDFSSSSLSFFFFFLTKKVVSCCIKFIFVVKDWIIVIGSEKRLSFAFYVCPQRKYYTPYGKISFQILWGINVKATHNCSSRPV